MRRTAGLAIIILCLARLVHDGASRRFRTLRKLKDERYSRSLCSASNHGNLREARRLARMRGSGNATFDGVSALHMAAWVGHTEVVDFLIANGANIDARAWNRVTPVVLAAVCGHDDIVKLLIARGAEVDSRTSQGRTALHAAVLEGRVSVAELLIAAGADVNAQDNAGMTPLDSADSEGRKAAAALLRKHGATTGKELDGEAAK